MDLNTHDVRPVVFEYEDYRVFLRELYHYFKAQKKQFSFRYFSKRAGFKSPNFLKLVIEKKRNLSSDSIQRFSAALKLSKMECEFFTYLVHFNQSLSEADKSHWSQQLMRSKGFQKIHPIKQAEYSYYANWFYIPIREMVVLKDFKEDSHWIANQFRPALTVEQVQSALNHLQELKMIYRDKNGGWVQTQRSITTGYEVNSHFVKQYHYQMIKKASESIELFPREVRDVSSVCIPISAAKMAEIKIKLQEFRRDILNFAESDVEAENVYQLNMQLFPLVLKSKDKL